jgi:hypothetical protein
MEARFKSSQFISLVFLFGLFMLVSCKRENSQTLTEEQQQQEASIASSEADAEAEIAFNDVFDDAMGVNDEVGIEGVGTLNRLTPCYTITVTRLNPPAAFPVKIVIDFGPSGCRGLDGHFRKGKIITEYTNRLLIAGASATTTFDGFYVDSIKVEGSHKIANTSSSNTIRQYTVDVTNAKLTKPSGNYVEWRNHKVITQSEGLLTVASTDDIFKIEGSAGGKVKKGALLVAWESNIIEPLLKKYSCRWIAKGKIRTVRANTTANSPWIATLDFGTGNCDNQAIITINGVSHQITLR